MNTRRLRLLSTALAPWVATAGLIAAPIGRPTPPPCAAEGSCVPKRSTWGYTKTTWRRWPGSTVDERAGEDAAVGEGRIGPVALPDPRSEDKLAPPKVEALEPVPDVPPNDSGFEMPSREEFENRDGPAGPERDARPDPLEPPRPGFVDRAPGGLPFEEPANGAAPAPAAPRVPMPDLPGAPAPGGPMAPPAGPTLPFGQPPAAPGGAMNGNPTAGQLKMAVRDDSPPRIPLTLMSYTNNQDQAGTKSPVVTAAAVITKGTQPHRASRIPTTEALVAPSDAPPQLPTTFQGGR